MITELKTIYKFDSVNEKELAKEFEKTHDLDKWIRSATDKYITYTNSVYYDNGDE